MIDLSGVANRAYEKAVNYGNKYLNDKLNYGLNYAKNFLRQYDVLGLMPEPWTLLDDKGERAFDFDAFMSAEIKHESKITAMPVEGSSFAAFNYVNSPLEIKCILAKQGLPEDLTAFADALLRYAQGLDLLSIVTPEREYQNMKLIGVQFGRSADTGTDIIYAECAFSEVRQVWAEYTNEKIQQKQSRGLQQGKAAETKPPRSWLSRALG